MRKMHASWDLLLINPADGRHVEARAADRVAPLESLGRHDEAARFAALELANRSRQWRVRPSFIQPPPWSELPFSIGPMLVGGLMTLATLPGLLSGARSRHRHEAVAWLGLGLVFLTLGALNFARRSRFYRPIRRYHRECCPDCGYDLSGSQDATPPFDRHTLGFPVGPERCPECEALWPLVPPALNTSTE